MSCISSSKGSFRSGKVAEICLFFVLFCLVSSALVAQKGPPTFTFTPRIVLPGGTLTISGENFSSTSTFVQIFIADENIQQISLGFAPLVDTGFTSSPMLPSNLVPGSYLVRVIDNAVQSAINLIGTLTVPPVDAPWFHYGPTTVAPGGFIAVLESGFDSSSPWAAVSLVDDLDQVRMLGFVGLNNGVFLKAFRIPIDLAPLRSYNVFVQNAFQQFAANTTGPVTLAFASVQPTIDVGFYPVGVAVDPFRNRIYVPNAGGDTLAVLDGATNTVIATVPVGSMPCAVAADPLTNRVYVANVNTNDVSVLDGATNTVIATVPAGNFPCAIGVVPSTNRIYVGNYSGRTVTVLDGATHTVMDTIEIGGDPFGLAVNPETNRIYVATGAENTLTVIDGNTNAVLTTVPVGTAPDAVGVNTITNRIYVANYFGRSVTVVDGETNSVIATIPVGKEPSGVGVNPITNLVYIGNYASNSLSILDGETNQIVETLKVGTTPDGVAVNPFTNRVYSVNSNSNNVSVIQ